jgi:hypothetical protein
MKLSALVAIGIALIGSTLASAGVRPFTYVYDTYPMVKGEWEYEQWLTYSRHTEEDSHFDRLDLRHEFEFGVADNFTLSFYVASWHYEDSAAAKGTGFDSASIETIVYLMNPTTDPIGLGLYAEFGVGEHEVEFEQKLLLQKDIGNWTFAYNLVVETEVEGVGHGEAEDGEEEEEVEVEGALEHAFGVSYAINPSIRVGLEATVETGFENWNDAGHTVVNVGPNINWQGGKNWWITVTPTMQVTDVEDEPDFAVRMIGALQF